MSIQEAFLTTTRSAAMTDAVHNANYAVRVNPAADTDPQADNLSDIVSGDLTGTTAAADEVLGELLSHDFEGVRSRVKNRGMLILRAKSAFAVTMKGQGVVSSDTAGVIQASGTVGTGLGRIIGGATVDSVHLYKVLV